MQPECRSKDEDLVRRTILDCGIMMIILLVGWVYTFGIEQVLDMGLYDESIYLNNGMRIPHGFPSAQGAPLYALWYYILSLLRHDTIQLYFLNFKMMTVLPPLALFIALRSFGVSRVVTILLALGFLFSTANFPTWPKVSHFAVLVLLSGFSLSSFVRCRILQASILSVTALLTAYIRPEYFLTFLCIAVVLAILTFLDVSRSRSLKGATPLLTTLLPCALIILWLGVPMGSGNRSMVAFGQHYAVNWVQWHSDTRHPWTNWKTIIANDFGAVDSVSQAALANPSAFTRHIFQNLNAFPGELKAMFGSTYPLNSTAHIAIGLGILIIAVAGLACLRWQDLTGLRQRIRDNFASFWFHLILIFFAILPVGLSIILIAPRRHYLYILGVLLILGFVGLVFRDTEESKGLSGYLNSALLCIIVLLIARPLPASLNAPPQPNLKTIEFLRDLNVRVPINILEAEGGYGIYVGENYNRVAEKDKNIPFAEFMADRSLDMIVTSPRLSQDVRFRDDPQWHSFTNDPARFGFARMAILGVDDRKLFVRREIIELIPGED